MLVPGPSPIVYNTEILFKFERSFFRYLVYVEGIPRPMSNPCSVVSSRAVRVPTVGGTPNFYVIFSKSMIRNNLKGLGAAILSNLCGVTTFRLHFWGTVVEWVAMLFCGESEEFIL